MTQKHIDRESMIEGIARLVKEDWLATGVSEDQWKQMLIISDIEDRLLASGWTIEEINEQWSGRDH